MPVGILALPSSLHVPCNSQVSATTSFKYRIPPEPSFEATTRSSMHSEAKMPCSDALEQIEPFSHTLSAAISNNLELQIIASLRVDCRIAESPPISVVRSQNESGETWTSRPNLRAPPFGCRNACPLIMMVFGGRIFRDRKSVDRSQSARWPRLRRIPGGSAEC